MSTALARRRSKQKGNGRGRSRLIRIGQLGALLLLLVIAGGVAWAAFPSAPMAEAIAALESDESVTVKTDQWLEFIPAKQPATTGFLFYPGGRVDARAYSPAMHEIAKAGTYAVIVPMMLNLAVLSPNRADEVIAAHPEIQHWVIAGHSLGGVMAASYAFNHPERIAGLELWAAYPQASNSLATRENLQVTSLYGTNDGLATVADIKQSVPLLPPIASFVAIEGGNHGQFGWYGEQSGDNPATISRQEQQEQIVAATLALLERVQRQ